MELVTILSALCVIINAIVVGVVSSFDIPGTTKGPVIFISVAGLASLITALVCCKRADWIM